MADDVKLPPPGKLTSCPGGVRKNSGRKKGFRFASKIKMRDLMDSCHSKEEWIEMFKGLPDVDQFKFRLQLEPKEVDVKSSDGSMTVFTHILRAPWDPDEVSSGKRPKALNDPNVIDVTPEPAEEPLGIPEETGATPE